MKVQHEQQQEQEEHKTLLCLAALCLPRTQWAADFLRALGTALKVPEPSVKGAVTLTYTSSSSSSSSSEEEEGQSMLDRAENMALSLRSTFANNQETAVKGFVTVFLLVLRGREYAAAVAASTKKKKKIDKEQRYDVLRFDARTSVMLRRLALLLRIKLSALAALEEHAIQQMQTESAMLQKQGGAKQQQQGKEKKTKSCWVRHAKIGAAATAAGGLLFVTGGLAAPALATGLAGLGLAGAAGLATTTTVATLLGGAGAGLGAYKMSRRTKGLTEFRFQKINREEQRPISNGDDANEDSEMKGMTVYICVSGMLRQPGASQDGTKKADASNSPDFYCPWGAEPPEMPTARMLHRFYSVVAPDKLLIVPLLVKYCAGREDDLMDKLSNVYNAHPKNLRPDSSRPSYFLSGKDAELYTQILNYGVAHVQNTMGVKAGDQPVEFPQAVSTLFIDDEKPWDGTVQSPIVQQMEGTSDAEDKIETKEEMEALVAEMDEKMKGDQRRDSLDQKILDSFTGEIERLGMRDTIPTGKATVGGSFGAMALDSILSSSSQEEVYWWRESVAKYGDQYTVVWDPDKLLEIGQCVKKLIREGVNKGIKKSLQYTALSAVLSAVALPMTIASLISGLDESWTMAVEAADEAGLLLADALMSEAHGNRPVVLIGYSVGGRVVAKCLTELAAIANGTTKKSGKAAKTYLDDDYEFLTQSIENDDSLSKEERKRRLRAATVVRDAVIIGAPCDTAATKWKQRRAIVLGRLINVYSPSDWVLSLLYRYKRWSVIPLAGLKEVKLGSKDDDEEEPLQSFQVENFDVSSIIESHGDYPSKIRDILRMVGIGDVDCEPYHAKYFL